MAIRELILLDWCCTMVSWNALALLLVAALLESSSHPLKAMAAKNSANIISTCSCGSIKAIIRPSTDVASEPVAVDCHCPNCRKYHVTAFATYLLIPKSQVTIEGETVKTFRDSCEEIGAVDRIFCSQCFTKIASRPVGEESTLSGELLVNMGPLNDTSIPDDYAALWRTRRSQWQLSSKASWTDARPQASRYNVASAGKVTGGCACGTCKYEIDYEPPTELQHCYCRLCRRLCGGPFMTWVPVYNDNIEWTDEPSLVRTTDHGQRHICPNCGGTLTIVYDDQPDMTWPAAGSFDDACIPSETGQMNSHLYRVCHICCRYRQKWYELPRDGLERISEAS